MLFHSDLSHLPTGVPYEFIMKVITKNLWQTCIVILNFAIFYFTLCGGPEIGTLVCDWLVESF